MWLIFGVLIFTWNRRLTPFFYIFKSVLMRPVCTSFHVVTHQKFVVFFFKKSVRLIESKRENGGRSLAVFSLIVWAVTQTQTPPSNDCFTLRTRSLYTSIPYSFGWTSRTRDIQPTFVSSMEKSVPTSFTLFVEFRFPTMRWSVTTRSLSVLPFTFSLVPSFSMTSSRLLACDV